MASIRAPAAWDVTTGSPDVVVAVLDTGIDLGHPDLSDNIWTNPDEIAGNGLDDDHNGYVDDVHGWDFAYDDNDPSDVYGHGTHVAGTVGAVGNNGIGVVGVNWRVQLVALKFLDDSGSGYDSDAIRALQYARDKGIRISNNSWGGGDYSRALYDAIASMRATGHLFVTAAGNYGLDNDFDPLYPCSFDLENVLCVASITSTDALSGFSNYSSTSVDIGAPGSSIYSTIPGGYATFSGTSMATPHVTGAAALLSGQHPDWTYAQMLTTILNTARPDSRLVGDHRDGRQARSLRGCHGLY
jgi:subtilisin family serine protease